jgi:hypothetical protein
MRAEERPFGVRESGSRFYPFNVFDQSTLIHQLLTKKPTADPPHSKTKARLQ